MKLSMETLPDCMMPDGGSACIAYHERYKQVITLLKIIEDAEHAEDCPLYGIRSAPLGDRLHICNCFKQRALKVTRCT